MKNQKGFSLIELLVVVIIIGIIAAIAIPSLLASRRSANESSAVANLRTVHTAEATFATTGTGAYDTFANVSAANILDASWTGSPVKNTYTFTYSPSTPAGVGFCVTAVSASTSSGAFSYAISHQGAIYRLAGIVAPACNATTGVISTGTVVGS